MNLTLISGNLLNPETNMDGSISGGFLFPYTRWNKAKQAEEVVLGEIEAFFPSQLCEKGFNDKDLLLQGSVNIEKDKNISVVTLNVSAVSYLKPDSEPVNIVAVAGRVGSIDVKHFERSSVASFSVATRKFVQSNEPDWHNCQARGWIASVVERLEKGRVVSVTGMLTLQEWSDRSTGLPRKKFVVEVQRLTPLTKAEDYSNASNGSGSYTCAAPEVGSPPAHRKFALEELDQF